MQPSASKPTRNQLIADHTEIARRIALKIARRCPAWMGREDLVAAGMRGLTEAANRYDATRAEPFLPFAEHRIRGAVLDELRRGDLLPRRVRTMARKVDCAIRYIEQCGHVANDERVADHLGVTVDHYRTRLAHLANVQVESLEGEAPTLCSNPDEQPDDLVSHRQMLTRLAAGLAHLEKRDAQIILYHFRDELSYQQIATIYGITPSRVCQLLWRAVSRLREQLGVTEAEYEAAS